MSNEGVQKVEWVRVEPNQEERKQKLEKVGKIFHQFDANGDGGLNRSEMTALVIAVNPRRNFSEEEMSLNWDEVSRVYGLHIQEDTGLSLDGLILLYDAGEGDVDRDFQALGLDLETVKSYASDEGQEVPGATEDEGPAVETENALFMKESRRSWFPLFPLRKSPHSYRRVRKWIA